MANSVEARVPFLDPVLVEYVYRLPVNYKLENGRSKIVLREAISDIVPQWVLDRRKQGFGAPVESWLQTDLGVLFERLLETDSIRAYFKADALRRALHNTRGGGTRSRMYLWPILNFALWHRHWIEGESIDELVRADLATA